MELVKKVSNCTQGKDIVVEMDGARYRHHQSGSLQTERDGCLPLYDMSDLQVKSRSGRVKIFFLNFHSANKALGYDAGFASISGGVDEQIHKNSV